MIPEYKIIPTWAIKAMSGMVILMIPLCIAAFLIPSTSGRILIFGRPTPNDPMVFETETTLEYVRPMFSGSSRTRLEHGDFYHVDNQDHNGVWLTYFDPQDPKGEVKNINFSEKWVAENLRRRDFRRVDEKSEEYTMAQARFKKSPGAMARN